MYKSSFLYWVKIQNSDGSFNEYYENDCSFRLSIQKDITNFDEVFSWLEGEKRMETKWLGNGNASKEITMHILDFLNYT